MGNSEAFGYLSWQVQSGMMLCGNLGYVGYLLKSDLKLCSWEVNEVLHYVGWQVTQNGDVWLVSMNLEAFSYMSW